MRSWLALLPLLFACEKSTIPSSSSSPTDKKSGLVLFMGRVVDPSAKS